MYSVIILSLSINLIILLLRLLWERTEVVQDEVGYPEVEGSLGPEPLVADLQENMLQLVSEEGGQG